MKDNEILVKLDENEIQLIRICLMIADLQHLEEIQSNVKTLLTKLEDLPF